MLQETPTPQTQWRGSVQRLQLVALRPGSDDWLRLPVLGHLSIKVAVPLTQLSRWLTYKLRVVMKGETIRETEAKNCFLYQIVIIYFSSAVKGCQT